MCISGNSKLQYWCIMSVSLDTANCSKNGVHVTIKAIISALVLKYMAPLLVCFSTALE